VNLYHGTSTKALKSIAAHGLQPRDKSNGNWKDTVPSRRDSVYLTRAYPLYFAMCAAGEQEADAAIIEVKFASLSPRWLHADEDAVEQSTRGRDNLPADWDTKRRTIYYRSRAHLYSADGSLRVLGNCAHRSAIPVHAIGRVAVLTREALARLIVEASDPVVTASAYRLFSKNHDAFGPWLFGDTSTYTTVHGRDYTNRDGVTVHDIREFQ